MKPELKTALEIYIKEFEAKHELAFDSAVGNDLMGVLDFGCTEFFSMSDIVEDIDNNYPKGLILQWHEDTIEHHPKYINLRSYATGLRYEKLNIKID